MPDHRQRSVKDQCYTERQGEVTKGSEEQGQQGNGAGRNRWAKGTDEAGRGSKRGGQETAGKTNRENKRQRECLARLIQEWQQYFAMKSSYADLK